MHGADRIGGLSSANGIVFGRIAGASAARAAQKEPEAALKADIALPEYGIAITDAERLRHSLKHTMSTYCMINRTETGLSEALHELEDLKAKATTLSTQKAQEAKSQPSPACNRRFNWQRRWSKPCANEPKA